MAPIRVLPPYAVEPERDESRSGVRPRTPVPPRGASEGLASDPPPTLRSALPPPASHARSTLLPPSSAAALSAGGVRRTEQIERKLALARIVLEDLPDNDPRARLLKIAITRRDAVLIEGVLGALQDAARRESGLSPLTGRERTRG